MTPASNLTPGPPSDEHLRRLLAVARQAPPALPLAEARRLVREAPAPRHGVRPRRPWRRFFDLFTPTRLVLMTLAALTTVLAVWLWPTPAAQPQRPQPGAASAPTTSMVAPADTARSGAGRAARRAARAARQARREGSQSGVAANDSLPHTMTMGPDSMPHFTVMPDQQVQIIMEDDSGNVVNTFYFNGRSTSDSTADGIPQEPLATVLPAPDAAAIRPDTATLAALGVVVTADRTSFRHRIVGGGNLGIDYTAVTAYLGGYPADPTPTALYPWFVTSLSGRETERYTLPHEDTAKRQPAYFAQMLARLVPVVVPVPTADVPGRAVIFWYEATPAFLAALPPALAAEVRCAYFPWLTAAAQRPAAGGAAPTTPAPAAPACERPAGPEPMVLVFPNPARGAVSIRTETGAAEAVLLNVSGHELRRWTTNLTAALALPTVPPGVYLLRIRLLDGRAVTRRLVVE